jgi:toxin-antitoxin system PIN domain toxin
MILVDANLLVYAHVRSFAQHDTARAWLDHQLTGPERVGLPWPSLLAFVRLVCNPRVFERPASIEAAWKQVVAWLSAPSVWVPGAGPKHQKILSGLIGVCTRSNLIHDAHLAALAMEYDLILCSTDHDFARFPGLRWIHPLKGVSEFRQGD